MGPRAAQANVEVIADLSAVPRTISGLRGDSQSLRQCLVRCSPQQRRASMAGTATGALASDAEGAVITMLRIVHPRLSPRR